MNRTLQAPTWCLWQLMNTASRYGCRRLIPETPDEIRRHGDALLRREHREAEGARRKEAREATAALENRVDAEQ